MRKHQDIHRLAHEACQSITIGGQWSDFLFTAAWNFRFRFADQVLIWAQRPTAQNCYSISDWNNRFHRRRNYGAKGIALLDNQKGLSYVYDFHDTHSQSQPEMKPWQLTEENTGFIRNSLAQAFQLQMSGSKTTSLYQLFQQTAYALLDTELDHALPVLMEERINCRLQELDPAVAERTFRSLLINSVTAMLMYRCGLDPSSELPKNAFASIIYFDTPHAASILGNSTQHMAEQILREIAVTVTRWEKDHPADRDNDSRGGDSSHIPNHFTESQIRDIILRAPQIEHGKYRIHKAVTGHNPNLEQLVRTEYSIGNQRFLFQDGTCCHVNHDFEGLHFRAEGYHPLNLSWAAVCTRIRHLIQENGYLTPEEHLQGQRHEAQQSALEQRQVWSETLRAFAAIYAPKDHDYNQRLQENLRAFVYERSETARNALLETFGALAHLPLVQTEASESLRTLLEGLSTFGEHSQPDKSIEPSAATMSRNPEPEVDHPELNLPRHFPTARADKDLLADLMTFVGNYRVTFRLRMPELSEHDRICYEQESVYADNLVVTDNIDTNAASIDCLVHYMNAWFLPFAEAIKPSLIPEMEALLSRAAQMDFEVLRRENPAPSVTSQTIPTQTDSEVPSYDASSFHEGDYYEDNHGRGVITRIYEGGFAGRHTPLFGLVDPEAESGSRDAKGYVMDMSAAIRLLNLGQATLTPASARPREQGRAPAEPSLFDFACDISAPETSITPNNAPQAAECATSRISTNCEETGGESHSPPDEACTPSEPLAGADASPAPKESLDQQIRSAVTRNKPLYIPRDSSPHQHHQTVIPEEDRQR